MSEYFHQLTPAELERLAILAEECGEVVQIVNKIIRHGYDSYHPSDEKKTSNKQLLVNEIVDILIAIAVMGENKDFEELEEPEMSEVYERKFKYMHHQEHIDSFN